VVNNLEPIRYNYTAELDTLSNNLESTWIQTFTTELDTVVNILKPTWLEEFTTEADTV
jgi:hypothetical protein